MPLSGSYNYVLVALSVFIGMSASYAAIDLAGRVTSARGWLRHAWLGGGAIAMGIGIWSMHFTGMQAFSLPVAINYDWPTVLLSLLAGIVAAGISLFVVSRQTMGSVRIVSASIIMGAAIVAVHYIAMDAMRMAAECRYNMAIVSLSALLAVLASFVGLWLSFHFRDEAEGVGWQKIAGAVEDVLGTTIPNSIYGGFAAHISPDGSKLAFVLTEATQALSTAGGMDEKIALVSLDPASKGSRQLLTPNPHITGSVHFTPDGKALAYGVRENGIDNIWLQPLDGSAGHYITKFTSEQSRGGFAWSPDGKTLAILRGHLDSDIVLLRDSGPAR